MVLESLRADAPVNIKNLVIESPRKPDSGLLFDPERDITEDDLRAVDERVKADVKNPDSFWRVVAAYADLKLLFPKRPMPVNFNSSEYFELVKEVFNEGSLLEARILFPNKAISDFTQETRDYLDEELQKAIDSASKGIYDFSDLVGLKLFYPEAAQQLLTDKKAVKNSLYEEIRRFRNGVDWVALAESAAFARIVLEDDYDLKLSAEDWQGMHKELRDSRGANAWGSFIDLASEMMILAAEKVRVTPNEGLVLTMPKPKADFRQHIPPLPQMRRF